MYMDTAPDREEYNINAENNQGATSRFGQLVRRETTSSHAISVYVEVVDIVNVDQGIGNLTVRQRIAGEDCKSDTLTHELLVRSEVVKRERAKAKYLVFGLPVTATSIEKANILTNHMASCVFSSRILTQPTLAGPCRVSNAVQSSTSFT